MSGAADQKPEPTIDRVPQKPQPWPIRITFVPEPTHEGERYSIGKPWAGVPTLNRLKKLLKASKRAWGFRAVEIFTADPEFSSAPVVMPPKRKSKVRTSA